MFLLDTSVLSQSQKKERIRAVDEWLRRQTAVAIPFPAFLEVEQGIYSLTDVKPDKAGELRDWLQTILDSEYEYPELTPQVARKLAEMYCCRPLKNLWYVDRQGRKNKKPGQDLFIAAIAIVHRLPIATLNTRDFAVIDRHFPLPGVYDPMNDRWEVQPSAWGGGRSEVWAEIEILDTLLCRFMHAPKGLAATALA